MAKRSKLDIIRDILKIVQDNHNIKYTPLLRRSNISSSNFKQYFADLLEKEFVQQTSRGKNKYVILTEKGSRFLEKYKTILGFIDEFGL